MSILLGVLFGSIALISYGFSDYWGPLASRKIGAIESNLLIRSIVTVFIAAAFILFFYPLPNVSHLTAAILLITGAFSIIGPVAYYKSTKVGNISINAGIANSWAVVTVILSVLFLKVSLVPLAAIGIVVIIAGTVLVSISPADLKALNLKNSAAGSQYALLAMFGWGVAYFLTIILVKQIGWFPTALLVSIIMTTYYVVMQKTLSIKYVKPRPVLLIIVLNAVFLTAAVFAYNAGVLSNPLIVPPIAAASPAVTIFLAVLRQKEKLEVNHISGIIMVVFGLVLLSI